MIGDTPATGAPHVKWLCRRFRERLAEATESSDTEDVAGEVDLLVGVW
jgi:hypothetical protein